MKRYIEKRGPIGVFDSGFGGLDVLRYVVKKLPQYDYLYLGDTARTPYGSRSREVIYQFTEQAVNFLFQQGCPLIILACGTASSEALRKIQQQYLNKNYPNRRVLGVIIPAAEEAAFLSNNGLVGIIGTEGTVASGAFERELLKVNPRLKVFSQSCPLLVPIVEAGERNSSLAELALEKYLKPLLKKEIDTLILGCTHYGLMRRKINKVTDQSVRIVSVGQSVARKFNIYLSRHPEIEKRLAKNRKIRFLTTDLTEKFRSLGGKFFGRAIKPEKVTLV